MLLSHQNDLGQYLGRRQLVRLDHLDVAYREQQRHQRWLGDILVQLGYLSAENLCQCLAELTGLPTIDLDQWSLSPERQQLLPEALANRCRVVVLGLEENDLSLALADPHHLFHLDLLRQHFGASYSLKLFLAPVTQIEAALVRLYRKAGESRVSEDIQYYVLDLLLMAVDRGVSDVHFRPSLHGMTVLWRIDSVLISYQDLDREQGQRLCGHIKLLSHLDLAENRRPQDGRFDLHYPGRNIHCRVSMIPTVHGESIVIRLLDQQRSLLSLMDLGFAPAQIQALESLMTSPQGLFVIAGPTGVGKTTTLYALLAHLAPGQRNIVTIEEPVEYILPNIRQIGIKADVVSFADSVRAVLRHDPDVIYLSEIRDADTAQMAFRATMSGHFVLATVHAASAQQVPFRLQDLGVPLSHQAGFYVGLMSQRLLRKRCPVCLGGCPSCHGSGYNGRIAVAEIVKTDQHFNQLLSEQASWYDLSQWFGQQTGSDIFHQGQQLCVEGVTTEAELRRVFGDRHV